MAYEFKLPDLGEGLTEGEIARWLVPEGQEIAEDEPLVEIATDKTTVEIPSPAAGVVSKIHVAEGEVVPVGTLLVVIGGNGEPPRAGQPAAPKARTASPQGDRSGRRRSCAGSPRSSASISRRSRAPGRRGASPRQDVRGTRRRPCSAGEGRREPIRGVKRQMFEHLTRAHREIPPVTWVEECDFTNVDLKRLLPLTLKAVAESLREFPELNARIEGTDLVYLDRYDLGIAVQTEQGLVVPVVRDCGSRRRRARRGREAARRRRAGGQARTRGAARRHVHRHERRQVGRPLHDAAREPPAGGDPRRLPHRRARGRP